MHASEEESQSHIYPLFITRKIKRAWIGYNDRAHEGKFSWIKGSGSYTNWMIGEPNGRKRENCGEIIMAWGFNGRLNDAPCQYKHPSICEKPSK